MIDLVRLREDPAWFARAWQNRGAAIDVPEILALDERVRRLKHESESTKAQANAASKAVAAAARGQGDLTAAKEEARHLGDEARRLDGERAQAEDRLRNRLLEIPNPCLDSVAVGADASANPVVSVWGRPPVLDCQPRPHWELAPALGIIDFERGARLAGSGFVVFIGLGARLCRALITWFLDRHLDNGYTEIMPPHLVRPEVLQGTGQLPKFADQYYRCAQDDLCLIPTAEVPVTNLFAGEILDAGRLPLRFCAYTPCFRREAGAAGVGTRGLTRVHQFDKVEMVWITRPEESQAALATMRGHAEALLQGLGLHYRVIELCTGDTGFAAAHTYDLEVWSPGTGTWLEVSSCSNCTDFQARRMALRYRGEPGAKPALVHTLNGSGLALPRCLIALLETYQRADGSIAIPEVLQPYMNGRTVIAP